MSSPSSSLSLSSPGSQDDAGSEDSFEEEATIIDNSVGNLDPEEQSQRGLSENVKKGLVADIIAAGGIDAVVVKALTASDPATYGSRITNKKGHRQVENLIQYWKSSSTAWQTAVLKYTDGKPPKTPPRKTPPHKTKTPSCSSGKKATGKKKKSVPSSPPPEAVFVDHSSPPICSFNPIQPTFSPGVVQSSPSLEAWLGTKPLLWPSELMPLHHIICSLFVCLFVCSKQKRL